MAAAFSLRKEYQMTGKNERKLKKWLFINNYKTLINLNKYYNKLLNKLRGYK
jgi:hypothetical protein